jgi:hypothetical protein
LRESDKPKKLAFLFTTLFRVWGHIFFRAGRGGTILHEYSLKKIVFWSKNRKNLMIFDEKMAFFCIRIEKMRIFFSKNLRKNIRETIRIFFIFRIWGGGACPLVPPSPSLATALHFRITKIHFFWRTLYKKVSTDGAEASDAKFILNGGRFDPQKLKFFVSWRKIVY